MSASGTVRKMTAIFVLLLVFANKLGISVDGAQLEDESALLDTFPMLDDFPANFEQLPSMKVPPFMLRIYERQKSRDNFGIIRALRNEFSEPLVESGCIRKMPISFNLSSLDQMESVLRAEIHVQLPDFIFGTTGNWTARKKRLMFQISNGSNNGRLPMRISSKYSDQLVFNVRNELVAIRQRTSMAFEIRATNTTCWPQSEPVEVQLVVQTRRKDRVGNKMKRYAGRNKNRKSFSKSSFQFQERSERNRCHRKELVVDFRAIGLKWVIEPRRYQAFVCQGFCRFPLSDHMNTTNHATVQAMMHSVNPRQVAPPCCVPTSLAPISMLYYDNSNNIVMRKYDNMIVTGCGCR